MPRGAQDPPKARVPRIRSYLARRSNAFIGGLLLSSGLAPFGWWLLALIGSALLARSLQHPSWRERFTQSGACGLGFLGPGLFWMAEIHMVGWILGVAIYTAFFGAVVALAPFLPTSNKQDASTQSPNVWAFFTYPAALVACDALRTAWPFGGVPIALISQTQVGGPLSELARLGGGLAITASVGVIGVIFAQLLPSLNSAKSGTRFALPQIGRSTLIGSTVGALVVLGVTIAAANAPRGHKLAEIQVAVVQGGGERGTRAIATDSNDVIRAHLAASSQVPKGVDLILWPEDVLETHGSLRNSAIDQGMAKLARSFGAPIAAGVFEVYDDYNVNSAVSWTKQGKISGRYDKNQLVPFGEFVPFRSFVDSLVDLSAIPKDARAGKGPAFISTSAAKLGVVICYESFFSRRTRAAMDAGAELLYVPTNANSYVTTQMPALQLSAARLRAIETGRYVLQASPTGFSAIVDPNGVVVARSDLGKRAVLSEIVQRRSGSTPYDKMGDGPIVVAAVVILATARMRRPKVEGMQERPVEQRA